MKKIKLGLLPQILIAIALGIAAGTVSPELPVRVFVTFNDFWLTGPHCSPVFFHSV